MIRQLKNLESILQVTYEYGIINPVRNIPFLRSMVPLLEAKTKYLRRLATDIRSRSTRTWPRWLIWSLEDSISTIEETERLLMKLSSDLKAHRYNSSESILAGLQTVGSDVLEILGEVPEPDGWNNHYD